MNNWSNLWTRCLHNFWPPHLCSSEEHKYGVPIVSPINFCYTFWRKTQQRQTAQTWDLARLLIYRYSIISEILGFRHSTVLILVFDVVKVQTTNTVSFRICVFKRNFFHDNIISHHVFLESNGSVFIWISWPYPYTFAAFQRKKGQMPEKGDGHALIWRSHHLLCLSVLHFF